MSQPNGSGGQSSGSSTGNYLGLLLVVIALLVVYSMLPLGTAIQFGEDEGYELMKGFLVSKGFKLYKEIWCDQTPLFPILFGWVFKSCGPSLLAARLIATGFGLVLFATFYQVVCRTCGRTAALLATFFLLASPVILKLSVSVMQEVPAFAIALVSALFLSRWLKNGNWTWLVASGAAMGIALGIKVTAALVVPAVLAQIALGPQTGGKPRSVKPVILNLLGWLAASGVVLAIITLLWGTGSVNATLKTQSIEQAGYGTERPDNFPMQTGLFVDHAECVAAAFVGLVLIARGRKLREFAFPCVMLFTTLAVHLFHRPWWGAYYLHIAIPLAWLAGFAAGEGISTVSKLLSNSRFNVFSKGTWKAVALCTLVALALVRSEGRLENGMKELRQCERIGASPLLAKMKQYAPRTHWIYVHYGMETYAFDAQLPMPPEIGVVSLKRFWSGQISNQEIINTCRQYRPEQLLLDHSEIAVDYWKDFLSSYFLAYEDESHRLYVSSTLNGAKP